MKPTDDATRRARASAQRWLDNNAIGECREQDEYLIYGKELAEEFQRRDRQTAARVRREQGFLRNAAQVVLRELDIIRERNRPGVKVHVITHTNLANALAKRPLRKGKIV